jgi:hypothetical protein
MDVTIQCPLLSIGRCAARPHDPVNGHAAPDHGVVVDMALTGDHGGAQGDGFGIGHLRDRTRNDFNKPCLIDRAAYPGRPGTAPVSPCSTPQGGAVLYFGGLRHMFSAANT